MELISRPKNDRYTRPGHYRELESGLKKNPADAHRLGDQRPFIVAGGAKAIYEAWDFFGFEYEGRRYSADVACTGEEFVLLELLDRIMAHRGPNEHPRQVFHRLRKAGLLNDIQGLVFRAGDEADPLTALIDTGMQRLVQD